MRSKVLFNNMPLPSFLDLIRIDYPVIDDFEYINGKFVPKGKEIVLEVAFNKRGMITSGQERQLINWVKGNNFDYSPLVLYNDEFNFYYAKLKSSFKVSGLKRGKLEIEFTCLPYKRELYDSTYTVNRVTMPYYGDAPVYPNLRFEVTGACNEIVLNHTDPEGKKTYIKLLGSFNYGDVITIDQEHNKVKINELLRMGIWALDSKRHKLSKGNNKYELVNGHANAKITYREMYY